MIALAIWIGALLAIVTTLTAIVKAALEVDESAKAESLSFVRLGLTGVFGIVAGQIWSPLQLSWYWPALFSTLMMVILLFGSQYAAKKLGHAKFGQKLLSIFSKTVDSIHLLFTPISLPKDRRARGI